MTKNVRLAVIGSWPWAFQRATDEPCTLPLNPPNGGTKRDFVFTRKFKFCQQKSTVKFRCAKTSRGKVVATQARSQRGARGALPPVTKFCPPKDMDINCITVWAGIQSQWVKFSRVIHSICECCSDSVCHCQWVSLHGWLQTADRREISLYIYLIIKQSINDSWTTACQLASARLYFAY